MNIKRTSITHFALIALVSMLAFTPNVFAQNKVVVVPLGGADNVVSYGDFVTAAGGYMTFNGTLSTEWGAPITINKTAVGHYPIRVYGIRPNCTGAVPQMLTQAQGASAHLVYIGDRTCFLPSGDILFDVYTTNTSGAAVNNNFFFYVVAPGGVPEDLAPGASAGQSTIDTNVTAEPKSQDCEYNPMIQLRTCWEH